MKKNLTITDEEINAFVTFGAWVEGLPTGDPDNDNDERLYNWMDRLPTTNDKPMVAAALSYAAWRDWHVFPVPPGTKKSYKSERFSGGRNWGATTDAKEINRDFKRWPKAGIGIVTGPKSGIFVVEADTLEGHDVDGLTAIKELQKKHGELPHTLKACSPSGSEHYYFNYPEGFTITNSVGRIAEGVDVCGDGGMVVGPPTERPGKGKYRWLNQNPVADAPQWLIDLCKEDVIERQPNEDKQADPKLVAAAMAIIPNDDLDWESWNSIGMACWAATGGSDEGLEAFDQMSQKSEDKYNPTETMKRWQGYFRSPPSRIGFGTLHHLADQASPGWRETYEAQELERAYASMRELSQEADASKPEAAKAEECKPSIHASPFKWIDPSKIPQREWVYRPDYIRKFSSLTLAPGGAGKSTAVIAEIVAMVSGKSLLGVRPAQPLRVWYWNGEDPADELQRRIAATCKHYGITKEDIGDRLFVDSGRTMPIVIAEDDKSGTRVAVPTMTEVIETLKANKIDVFIIDPFVSVHRVAENDNTGIEKVAKSFSNIAEAANCSVMLIHHSRKTYGQDITAEDGRGASALLAAVRAARTLNVMSKEEAKNFDIEEGERRRYIRSDNGKSNMTRPADKADWYRLESVELGNSGFGSVGGDEVGVATKWEAPEFAARIADTEGILKVQAVMDAGGPWRESPQSQKEPWVGLAIGEAFSYISSGSMPQRARKHVNETIAAWLKDGWLKCVEKSDDKRVLRKYIEVGKRPPAPPAVD